MSLSNNKSVHITLFKEKESFFKRSFNKHILLIFNNLTIFLIFLKIHAQFFNLSLILTKIFYFSLNFYYKYNNTHSIFDLKFYKHYFFTYFNIFFNKLIETSNKIKNLINLFFIKFFNKIKKINNLFNKKLFILYNFNIFLIGKNYNVYTGNIIPFYQKKLMWFIGTGLKMDGECSESVLTAEEYNKLIWCNFEKNSVIKIQNFSTNLKNYNIHKRLKHYYYLYLNFTFKYVKLQKKNILKFSKNLVSLNNLYYLKFYKTQKFKTIIQNRTKQIKNFSYNFFLSLFTSLIHTFKSFYSFLNIENKKMNFFFYFLNSFFIYLKSIILFSKLLKIFKYFYLNNNNNLPIIFNKFYSVNLLNLYFFNNLFENKKLYFLFFNFFIKKKLIVKKKYKFNYLKLLNRQINLKFLRKKQFRFLKKIKLNKKKLNKIKLIKIKLLKKFCKFNLNFLIFKKFKLNSIKKKYKIKKLKNKKKLQLFRKSLIKKKKYKFYIKFIKNKKKLKKRKRKKKKLIKKLKKINKRKKIKQRKKLSKLSNTKKRIFNQIKQQNQLIMKNLIRRIKVLKITLNKKRKFKNIKLIKRYKKKKKFLKKYFIILKNYKISLKRKNIIKYKRFSQNFNSLINLKRKKKIRKFKKYKLLKKLNWIILRRFKHRYYNKRYNKHYNPNYNPHYKRYKRYNNRFKRYSNRFKDKYNYFLKRFTYKFNRKNENLKKQEIVVLKNKQTKLKKFIKLIFKKNKTKKNINLLSFFKVINKKIFYINNILNKKYLNFIISATYNKYNFFNKFKLILFNNLYFFKIFSIFSFLFKLNFFFKNILIKKYEFFFYYKNFYIFEEMLEDLNDFNIVFKNNKFNFIYIYKIIFEKILNIESYLKQFFFILIKIKKNCFKYKYFFFNIIKYLIILKKKYLYLTTLDFFFNIINKKFLLSEKFTTKLMTLCTLKKKCLLTLKKKLKNKYKFVLMKKKTKKYFRYIVRNLRKTKKKIRFVK